MSLVVPFNICVYWGWVWWLVIHNLCEDYYAIWEHFMIDVQWFSNLFSSSHICCLYNLGPYYLHSKLLEQFVLCHYTFVMPSCCLILLAVSLLCYLTFPFKMFSDYKMDKDISKYLKMFYFLLFGIYSCGKRNLRSFKI